jgi:hypothetical protein
MEGGGGAATTLLDGASTRQGAGMTMEGREDGAYHLNLTKSRSSRMLFAQGRIRQGVTLGNEDVAVMELG